MNLSRDEYIVLSVPWKVREVPAGDSRIDDDYGKCDFNNYIIFICADGPWQERLETLLHETMHIITRGRDLYDLTREDDLRTFSEVLADTLIRNGLIVAD